MVNILLFGSTTQTGRFILKNYKRYLKNSTIYNFSSHKDAKFYNDLKEFNFPKIVQKNQEFIIISLAPIWLFIPYLQSLLNQKSVLKKNILGIIVISSTSAITKKYAWNKYDKSLSQKLNFWENRLFKIKNEYKIKIKLVRPTMIYGDIGKSEDKNISILSKIIANTFILPIPKETGLRQPIHYSQLAMSIIISAKSLIKKDKKDYIFSEVLNIGGDEELTYEEILKRIKKSLPNTNFKKRFLIIKIPNRLFFMICIPIQIFSPKLYEAIQRITVNMNGFTKSYKISKTNKKVFPINSIS